MDALLKARVNMDKCSLKSQQLTTLTVLSAWGKVKLYKDAGRINEETLLIDVAKFSTVSRSVEKGNIFFALFK